MPPLYHILGRSYISKLLCIGCRGEHRSPVQFCVAPNCTGGYGIRPYAVGEHSICSREVCCYCELLQASTARPCVLCSPELLHLFPTIFKNRSFSFHILRLYYKCSPEGSRDPERERDPKFFHPYSSFLLTPGRCRVVPAPLWCFLVQGLHFVRIYIIIETLPIVAKNRIIT